MDSTTATTTYSIQNVLGTAKHEVVRHTRTIRNGEIIARQADVVFTAFSRSAAVAAKARFER